MVQAALTTITEQAEQLREVQQILDSGTGTSAERRNQFDTMAGNLTQSPDMVLQHIGRTMISFAPGLFAGGDIVGLPVDNLDLERSFRLPKGHERRIHGHAHAGVRIVQRGSTLLLVLDAHVRHPAPFHTDELIPWLDAKMPTSQRECLRRGRIMRRARSSKRRPLLLAELERRYREAIHAS